MGIFIKERCPREKLNSDQGWRRLEGFMEEVALRMGLH